MHYEDATFKKQYISNVPAITNAASMSVVAISIKILINIVKPLVKQIS